MPVQQQWQATGVSRGHQPSRREGLPGGRGPPQRTVARWGTKNTHIWPAPPARRLVLRLEVCAQLQETLCVPLGPITAPCAQAPPSCEPPDRSCLALPKPPQSHGKFSPRNQEQKPTLACCLLPPGPPGQVTPSLRAASPSALRLTGLSPGHQYCWQIKLRKPSCWGLPSAPWIRASAKVSYSRCSAQFCRSQSHTGPVSSLVWRGDAGGRADVRLAPGFWSLIVA